jgi:hypothetical protein
VNYYLPDSDAKVYANLVNAALKAGVPVSYNDNPLLSASLPADLKVKLKDYNPQTDAMCTMLWDAYKVQVLKELLARTTAITSRKAVRSYWRLCGNGSASMVTKHPLVRT